MTLTRILFALIACLVPATALAAPVKTPFWHAFPSDGARAFVRQMAAEFNAAQSRVEIVPVEIGDYGTLATRLIAAARSGGLPAMTMVDNGFFTRLAVGGQLAPLDAFTDGLARDVVNDFYPVLWNHGEVGGKRYGLPFAASTLLLYYNANVFQARGLAAPKTWDEFARVARLLSSRASYGAVYLVDAWPFTSLVASRGGSVLTADNKPNFDGPAVVGALEFLGGLAREKAIIPRSLNELDLALLDFLRTKAMMVVAPSSAYQAASNYSLAFKIGVAAIPGRSIAGEAQFTVMKGATPEVQRGAYEFWQHMTRAENFAKLVRAGSYLPIRRSLARTLGPSFMTANPAVGAGMDALENAFNMPHVVEFNDWRLYLERAVERSLKGNVDAKTTLAEAQKLSLAVNTSR